MPWLIVVLIIMMIAAAAMSLMAGGVPPATKSDPSLDVPTSEIGIPIPILFGTRMIKTPRIVWWGALKIVKVKVNVQGKK